MRKQRDTHTECNSNQFIHPGEENIASKAAHERGAMANRTLNTETRPKYPTTTSHAPTIYFQGSLACIHLTTPRTSHHLPTTTLTGKGGRDNPGLSLALINLRCPFSAEKPSFLGGGAASKCAGLALRNTANQRHFAGFLAEAHPPDWASLPGTGPTEPTPI